MKLYRIKKSRIDNRGRGLYATKDIKSGTKIINYIGKIITNKQAEESDKFDNKKPIYLFTLNKKYTLDGDFPWNIAGLINHSCDNNCDYGFGFDEDYKQFPCKCRAKNCCGYIVRAESRWRINKKFAMSNKSKLINYSY